MTRRLTLLLAALEAVVIVGIGVAIPLAPLTVLWAAQYGFAPDWFIFWRAAADSWLVGHGVDLRVTLDPLLAATLAAPPEQTTIWITMAALGFALLTVLLGSHAGRRIADTGHPLLGTIATLGVFGALSSGIVLSAVNEAVRPSLVQGALLPTMTFAIGVALGHLRALHDHREPGDPPPRWLRSWSPTVRASAAAALRAGAASVALVLLVSAAATALLIVVHYAEIIRLYEGLHGGYAGGVALTVGQLAILPNLVIWTMSWFIGPGFAIGAGSSVSPLGTSLGPIPAIPVLGALPTEEFAFGFVGLAVPIVAGFLAGVATRGGFLRALGRDDRPRWFALATLGGGVFGGLLMGLLAWASSGSAGPGRLQHVGPDPLLVGLVAAAEFTVAIGIGLAVGGATRPQLRMPRPRRREKVATQDRADTEPIELPTRAPSLVE